ncbi:MAG: hypothetical protein ACKVRN_07955 [Pyrinomonadaceae bacterium]
MSNVIVLDDAIFTKLEKNAQKRGVTPEVWIENVVDKEFEIANLPRFSKGERTAANEYSKELDRRYAELMKKKRLKKMGLDKK